LHDDVHEYGGSKWRNSLLEMKKQLNQPSEQRDVLFIYLLLKSYTEYTTDRKNKQQKVEKKEKK